VVKSRRRWARHVAFMEEMRIPTHFNSEQSFGRLRCTWGIYVMDFRKYSVRLQIGLIGLCLGSGGRMD